MGGARVGGLEMPVGTRNISAGEVERNATIVGDLSREP